MILHVFTKRTKGGEPIKIDCEWKDGFYESAVIKKKATDTWISYILSTYSEILEVVKDKRLEAHIFLLDPAR